MKRWITRLLYGLLFAIPLMFITNAIAQASPPAQSETPSGTLDCKLCHQAFYTAWEQSGHGMATKDPAFQNSWNEQGNPPECLVCHVTGYDAETNTWAADGITCEACHSPIVTNHPLAPMAADRSAKLCGECHTETYFEWQVSAHREAGLECAGCHDPHKTGLKADSGAMLCASCHRDRSSNFTHSAHSQQGLTCANCHLTELTSEAVEGHAGKDHSFFVSLSACNSCHVYEMHDPVEVHPEHDLPGPADAMASVENVSVSTEPRPVSPLGFTTLSGIIGVALGVIIAPWIERLNRGSRFRDDEEDEEGESR